MRKLDLSKLASSKEFEELCSEILKSEYPDGRSYDDTTGDHGIDFSRAKESVLYQFYYPSPSKVTDQTRKIKRKILQSINKVVSLKPKEWHLVIPCKAQRAVYTYLEKKQQENPTIHLEIIDETAIQVMLANHPPLHEVWLQRVYGGVDENLSAEAYAYKYRNRPDKLLSMGRDVAQAIKHWQYGELYHYVKIDHGKTGQSILNVHANTPEIAETHPIAIEGELRFEKGDPKLIEYQEFLADSTHTKKIRLSREHIANMRTTICGQLWHEMKDIEYLDIIPVEEPPRRIDIRFFDDHHCQIGALLDYRFTRKLTEESAELNCSKESGSACLVTIRVDFHSSSCGLNLEKNGKLSTAEQAYEFMLMVETLKKSRSIEIQLDGSNDMIELEKPASRLSKYERQMLDVAKKMKMISEMMRMEMPSILDVDYTPRDLETILIVFEILRTGKTTRKFTDFKLTLSKPDMEKVSGLRKGKHFRMKFMDRVEYKMLGMNLDMGEVTRYFHISIDDEAERTVQRYIEEGKGDLVLKLMAPENRNEVTDFYHRWHRKPSEIEAFEK